MCIRDSPPPPWTLIYFAENKIQIQKDLDWNRVTRYPACPKIQISDFPFSGFWGKGDVVEMNGLYVCM